MFERSLSTTTMGTVVVGIERVTTTTVVVGIKWVNIVVCPTVTYLVLRFQSPCQVCHGCSTLGEIFFDENVLSLQCAL